MPNIPDPVERVVRGLGQVRAEARTLFLDEVDKILGQADTSIIRESQKVKWMLRDWERPLKAATLRSVNLPGIGKLTEMSTRLPGGGRITGIFG